MTPARTRLDIALVERGLMPSRARARDAILRGTVTVGGVTVCKPGMDVAGDAEIGVADAASQWVSRAALKLIAGLDAFGIDVEGLTALDIGASTGGFTQVLLDRGAADVYAIDVGHGQLHPSIAADPRVKATEGLNARDLTLAHLGGVQPEVVVCDTSFISLKRVLPPALGLAAPGAHGVFLVKPQFEAGRDAIGKGGLLKNPNDAPMIAEEVSRWLDAQPGWQSLGVTDSPISGGDGNREFLLGGVKT
ncbi:MAG: TlyA family RNA methyltransferase [Rhizobiaceae bacterium]|jgi:23S rRNA (cytidine1920-2'-O)/16S rRNA (cytidine1409-2'-O)-methyltransferase|nr:TlyA family RNA methyltransferase [Rhizobiaceae bacterium]